MTFWCLSPTIAKMILNLVLENISLKFNVTVIAFETSYYSNSKIEFRFAELSFCRVLCNKNICFAMVGERHQNPPKIDIISSKYNFLKKIQLHLNIKQKYSTNPHKKLYFA